MHLWCVFFISRPLFGEAELDGLQSAIDELLPQWSSELRATQGEDSPAGAAVGRGARLYQAIHELAPRKRGVGNAVLTGAYDGLSFFLTHSGRALPPEDARAREKPRLTAGVGREDQEGVAGGQRRGRIGDESLAVEIHKRAGLQSAVGAKAFCGQSRIAPRQLGHDFVEPCAGGFRAVHAGPLPGNAEQFDRDAHRARAGGSVQKETYGPFYVPRYGFSTSQMLR